MQSIIRYSTIAELIHLLEKEVLLMRNFALH